MTDPGTSRWEQLNESGRLYFLKGDVRRAEDAFREAVAEAEREGDALRLSSSLGNLAQLRYQQRDLDDAEALFRRSIVLREKAVGPDHVSVAQPLNNLAALHVARGEHAEAQGLLARALRVVEKHRPDTHPDVTVTLNNLAKLHFKRGDFAAAEPLLLRLLAAKQAGGKDHPEVATVLTSLATLRLATGHPAQAEVMWREALDIRERAGKPTDPSLAPILDGLADACAAQERTTEALALRERALAIREVALGPAHASVVAARGKLEEMRASLAAAPAPRAGPRPAPRLSALKMTALDDAAPEPAPRRGGELPDERKPLQPPAGPQENAWLREAEPPSHIIDGGSAGGTAVASPPRRTPPYVPTIPRNSGATPRPAALRNSELAAATEERAVPTNAAPVGDTGSWFNSAVAPTPAIPVAAIPAAPAPVPPAPTAPAAPAEPSVPQARVSSAVRAPVPAPRVSMPVPMAPEPARTHAVEPPEPARPPRRRPAARFVERQASSRRPLVAIVAIVAIAGAAAWLSLGRRDAGATRAAEARTAPSAPSAVTEAPISVPAPRVKAPAAVASSAGRSATDSASVDSARRARTSLDVTLPAAPSLDRLTRALDDSASRIRRGVNIDVRPPSLNEP